MTESHDPPPGEGERESSAPIDRTDAPGLVRLAVGAWWETNLWTARAALKASRRLARAARSGESTGALVDDARHEIADAGRRLLGIADPRSGSSSVRSQLADYDDGSLRAGWESLVDLSAEVEVEEVDGHPAFAGILRELHPDEARILRLLATDGPQASVDVRTWRPLGIGSHVVAPGVNMIGQHAGCLMVGRVSVYLSNLFRLGMIWFSRDAIPQIGPYQVLEAQPEVTEALKRAGRGTTVRRSIQLTPFGRQFCDACLPEDLTALEVEARPIDEVPPPRSDPGAALP